MIILLIVVLGVLILVATILPNEPSLSLFELDRRKKHSDQSIYLDVQREQLSKDVISLQKALTALLLVIFVLVSTATFGVLLGIVVGVITALQYAAVARFAIVHNKGQALYNKYEIQILGFLEKHRHIIRCFRSVTPESKETYITSKDELEDMVVRSHSVLSKDEKTQIISSLHFEDKIVSDIMTPKSVVDTIPNHEILGPLVLDDLHKTGHSRFPVINGDIDHVVGILHLRDVLTIDSTKQHTARIEAAMSKKVFYIRQDHSLSQALSAFLRTHHHLFIVINEFSETVGIITLEDTLEALLGRPIIDEFDAHDDMRAVATRQAAKKVNQAPNSSEV